MINRDRHYSWIDQVILQIQAGVETIFGNPRSHRSPGTETQPEPVLTPTEKKHSVGYMRVNHSGEVCAQALYRGQCQVARNPDIRQFLTQAAQEETDHLQWCQQRLTALGGHRSYLNIFWYSHAFLIGMAAGCVGDAWSLGFVEETEKQVEAHLTQHLQRLPVVDSKSRYIIHRMKTDEANHGKAAKQLGAKTLPDSVKKLMSLHAKVMTTLAYYL